jgi:ADP-ribose pyrophosphatase
MDVKHLKHEVLYRGKIFDLIVDEIEYPSGNLGKREIAHHPGGSVTVPLLDDGRVVLVKQLRYPLGEHILELPAGKLGPGEDPAVCAARELTEETGWVAGNLTRLTSMYTTPGFCDEVLHIFLATNLHESPEGHRREEGEFSMTVHLIPLTEAVAMIDRGEIRDGKSIVGLLMAERKVGRM